VNSGGYKRKGAFNCGREGLCDADESLSTVFLGD